MKTRIAIGITMAAVAALGLSACSSKDDGGAPAAQPTTTQAEAPAPQDPSPTAAGGDQMGGESLTTADTALGTIVVDGEGHTVYQFDGDTQGAGASACTGACLTNWPPVHGSDAASLTGITGEVGTITGTDGQPQLTLNGWPLYYYAADAAAGDTNGQGVGGVWWVLTPAGERVTS